MKQMMTHFFFILLFLCFNVSQLHAQHFLWGRSGGANAPTQGVDDETVVDMATDRNGNVYILSQVMTQGLEIAGQPLTGWGANDIMLASFTADGSLRWVKLIGNGDVDRCDWLGTDDKDGVYFVGQANKSNNATHIDKDATSPKANQYNILVKYDTSGVYQWHRYPAADTFTSPILFSHAGTRAMDVGASGTVYWLMQLCPGGYGGGKLHVTDTSIYLLKYNASGGFSYKKPDVEISGSGMLMAMTVDEASGRFYLSGYKSKSGGGSVTMGGSPITGSMYIGCFELDGTYLWHKENTSGDGLFHSRAVVDAAGDIYVAGEARAAGLSGNQPTVFNGYTVTDGGGHGTPFISKMDKSGNLIWAKTARVNGKSGAKAVALRNKDELVIAGSFPGMLEWPGYSSVVFNSPANYYFDMFVTRMSTHDGTVLGLDRIPSNFGYYEFPNSMASDGKGNVYIGGEFTSVMYVNEEDTLLNTGGGQTDWFLVKYGDMWPVSAGGAASMPTVKVYPNPATEQLMVAGVEPGTGIQLLNMPGQLVRQTTSEGSTAVINTGGLPPGSYLLQLTGKDGSRQVFRVEKL